MLRPQKFPDLSKPLNYKLSEWFLENKNHLRRAEEECKLAERIRAESVRVRDTVFESIETNKNETNKQFDQRIKETEFRRDEIERIRTQIQLELDTLDGMDTRVTAALNYLRGNGIIITQKCIYLRNQRIGIDLVNDKISVELQHEIETIQNAMMMLKKSLDQIKEYERKMRASLYSLNKDLQDKMTGLQIDKESYSLKETNVGLSVYEGTEYLDPSLLTLEEWEQFTDASLKEATKKVNASRMLRISLDVTLKNIEHELRNQDNLVNEAFRERIEQVRFEKGRLETRHAEVVRQANEMHLAIMELEKAIADKEGYLALAHTRLGKRAQRPGAELTRDEVNKSLSHEIIEIKAGVAELAKKLAQAKGVQRQLLKCQVQLEEDINIKINSLKLDEVDCMTLRQGIQHPVL